VKNDETHFVSKVRMTLEDNLDMDVEALKKEVRP
jgi:hypothetical protein